MTWNTLITDFSRNLKYSPQGINCESLRAVSATLYDFQLQAKDTELSEFRKRLSKVKERAEKNLHCVPGISSELSQRFITFISEKIVDVSRKIEEELRYRELVKAFPQKSNSQMLLTAHQTSSVSTSVASLASSESSALMLYDAFDEREMLRSYVSGQKLPNFTKFTEAFKNKINCFLSNDGYDEEIKKEIQGLLESNLAPFDKYTLEQQKVLSELFDNWLAAMKDRLGHVLPKHQPHYQEMISQKIRLENFIIEAEKINEVQNKLGKFAESKALSLYLSPDEILQNLQQKAESQSITREMLTDAMELNTKLYGEHDVIESFFYLFKLLMRVESLSEDERCLLNSTDKDEKNRDELPLSVRFGEMVEDLHHNISEIVADIREQFVTKLPQRLSPEEQKVYRERFINDVHVREGVVLTDVGAIRSSKPQPTSHYPSDQVQRLTGSSPGSIPALTAGPAFSSSTSHSSSQLAKTESFQRSNRLSIQQAKTSAELILRPQLKKHVNRYANPKDTNSHNDFKKRFEVSQKAIIDFDRLYPQSKKYVLENVLFELCEMNFQTYTVSQLTELDRYFSKLSTYIEQVEPYSSYESAEKKLHLDTAPLRNFLGAIWIELQSRRVTGEKILLNPEFIDSIYYSSFTDFSNLFEPMLERFDSLKLCEFSVLYKMISGMQGFFEVNRPSAIDRYDLGYFIVKTLERTKKHRNYTLLHLKIEEMLASLCKTYYSEEGSYSESNPMNQRAAQANREGPESSSTASRLSKEFSKLQLVLLSEEEQSLPNANNLSRSRNLKLYEDIKSLLSRGKKKALNPMIMHLHPDRSMQEYSIKWALDLEYGTLSKNERTRLSVYLSKIVN